MKNYKEDVPFEKQMEILREIEYVDAIPVTFDPSVNPKERRSFMAQFGIAPGTVVVPTYSEPRIAGGTLTNRDPAIRREFTDKAKAAMDFCHEIGGVDVMLWLAHDGFDYPFEDDYNTRYGWLADNLHEIAAHRSDVKVTIEYKQADPRICQYIGNAPKALCLCSEVGLSNLGVILDYGHALIAGENPAESAVLLNRYNRLFHIHLSDNYCKTDDDMLIGSTTIWRTLEFFWHLQQMGYDGYYVLDIWPPRMDGVEATRKSVKRTLALWKIAESLPASELRRLQREGNVPAIYDMLTDYTLKI
jgi:xylose isomerase